MKTYLLTKLRLSADEFTKTAWLSILFFLLVNGIFFGRNARDSIFLVKVGLAALPYAYMLNAVLAIGSALIYAMFVDKLDRFKLVRSILILFIGSLAGIYLVLPFEMKWFYWATYSLVQVIWLMSLMMFWTFAADFFDVVQSKRIFPMIGIGGLVGMITSGLIAKPLVRTFGTEKLFVAWAVLLGLAMAVVSTLRASRPAAKPAPARAGARQSQTSQWEQLKEGFRNVRRTPLLLNMVVMILALWLVFTIIDYQFNQVARLQYPVKDDLTAFLGIFRSLAGGCCLVFQLFLTPLIIRKIGVAGAMTLHPAFLILSIGGMAATFGFWPTCFTKFGDHVLLYTATDVAYQLLFNPIPSAQRGRARAFVEGYIKPFSMGLAGAALLILVELDLSASQIAVCNLFLALVWFLSAFVLKKNYLQAVVSNLAASQSSAPIHAALSAEHSAAQIKLMTERLRSAQPEEVMFAIEYFILVKHEPAAALCLPLLSHPNDTVRRTACRAAGQLGGPEVLPPLEAALRDRSPGVVREALAGIRRLGSEEQLPALAVLRRHPDLSIVAEGIETEAEVGGFDGILGTAEMLKRWSAGDDPRELELLASILGRLKIKSFLPILLQLSRHKNEKVAAAAVKALTEFKDDRVLPALVDSLRDDILFPKIQHYISSLGEKFRETVLALYRRDTTSLRVKRRFLEAIARSSKWDPGEILIEEMASEDPVIRFLCVKYMSERPADGAGVERAPALLKKELAHWIRIETIRQSLDAENGKPDTRKLLDLVFGEELHRTRKTVFLALGFLKDRATMRRIYRNCFYGAPNERALAVEAVENLNLNPWAAVLLPLLAGGLDEARTEFLKISAESHFDLDRMIGELITQSHDYLLSAILYAWRENHDTRRLPVALSLKSHTSSLVREHADAAAAALQ